jgi:hypothetical protein
VLANFDVSSSGAGRIEVDIKWGTTGGDTSGTQLVGFTQVAYSVAAGTTALYNTGFTGIVTPASTSLLYFKPIIKKHDSGTGYLNFYDSYSSIILMEIKA